MTRESHDRIARLLVQAEGFLLLELPGRALEILRSRADWPGLRFESSFLTGEALRALGRYREALVPLEIAAELQPENVGVAISLGWCYKRTHHLAQAIGALERASRVHPEEPLLHYNLACYWSLAGNPTRSVEELARALALDPKLRALLARETDFDAVRHLPRFQELLADRRAEQEPAADPS
jgi:tetratricopeptide (TPR) repeat protein